MLNSINEPRFVSEVACSSIAMVSSPAELAPGDKQFILASRSCSSRVHLMLAYALASEICSTAAAECAFVAEEQRGSGPLPVEKTPEKMAVSSPQACDYINRHCSKR